ncbi:MAG TPA: ABC transporter ATP-binding protein [Armatimonadota bacterium]|nr:ABC transporter ATP-binding protein [Armatimonadota bacterium]
MQPAIELTGVRKTYRVRGAAPVPAIDGVTLAVQPGEVFGFLGRNGAGKTTTVKVLLGMVPQYEGSARLFGIDARRPAARFRTGYLAETPEFAPHATVREILSLHARLAGMKRGAGEDRAEELIDLVDLRGAVGRRVGGFSKGMIQRLGVAVALIGEPRLVFLDEPTANLDPVGRRMVRDVLVGLRNQGITVFLSSHMLSEVEMTCTRVAIMDAGRIVRAGTVDELTRTVHYVHIGVTTVSDGLLADLRSALANVREMQGYIVGEIRSESDLDPIPGIVERHGARLRYLAMAHETLEDAFLRTVGVKGASG